MSAEPMAQRPTDYPNPACDSCGARSYDLLAPACEECGGTLCGNCCWRAQTKTAVVSGEEVGG